MYVMSVHLDICSGFFIWKLDGVLINVLQIALYVSIPSTELLAGTSSDKMTYYGKSRIV